MVSYGGGANSTALLIGLHQHRIPVDLILFADTGAEHPHTYAYLAQHLDVLLPPELLDAIDPVPFGNHAMQEEQGCFTSRGYLTLSGDEWEHERPRERQTEKKPSIKERLEQSRKECANQSKAQPHREMPAPER